MNKFNHLALSEKQFDADLAPLMHPPEAFKHPQDVASRPDLTIEEKRAILASWASDACAVEAAPALRRPPGSRRTFSVDEILATLCSLDREADSHGRYHAAPEARVGRVDLAGVAAGQA